jgi:hypothetical protein
MIAIVSAYFYIFAVVWTCIGALATLIELVHVLRDLTRRPSKR